MAAGNRKTVSDKAKGKAPAKKRQNDDGSDDENVEDRIDENAGEPEPPKKRARKETARQRDARQNDEDDREARREQRQAAERRRQERADDQAASMFVEIDNETEREALLRTTASDLRAQNARLEAELAQARALSRRQYQQEVDGATSSAGASGSGSSGSGAHASTPGDSDSNWPADDSIQPPLRVSNITMADIRAHLNLADDDTQWLRIRALLRDFMCMAALDFGMPWKQQDKVRLANLYTLIRERIPRFRRFANNWAGELVVQDIFNHRRTHMLKLERENKNPNARRTAEKHNGTSKEVNLKRVQRDEASKRQRSPSDDEDDNNDNQAPPSSPSSPDQDRSSPTGWPGSRAASPDSAPQTNESPRQEGARSNHEHDAGEEGEDVPATGPRRSNRRAQASLAAAALAAADGAAEDDDSTRKAAGSGKKGGRGKSKPKPKKGRDEELFPEEGEEDNGDDD